MSKNTQGPWTASIGNKGAHVHVNNDYNNPLSFGFNWNEHDNAEREEGQANARLIAASPELLDACKVAVHLLRRLPIEIECESECNSLQAAILKAEGRET